MMPSFGSSIPDMAFEQLDHFTIIAIREQLINIINYDPRVEFRTDGALPTGIRVIPLPEENALVASVDLYYVELDVSEVLDINLEFSA
jgi:hypothetical protein